MKCKECDACHLCSYTRWNPEEQCMNQIDVYECWGVKEPFEISDINQECTEYQERRAMKVGCNVCDGDYHQSIQSYVFRFHNSNKVTADNINTHYCPNCGRKLLE